MEIYEVQVGGDTVDVHDTKEAAIKACPVGGQVVDGNAGKVVYMRTAEAEAEPESEPESAETRVADPLDLLLSDMAKTPEETNVQSELPAEATTVPAFRKRNEQREALAAQILSGAMVLALQDASKLGYLAQLSVRAAHMLEELCSLSAEELESVAPAAGGAGGETYEVDDRGNIRSYEKKQHGPAKGGRTVYQRKS